ncbi:unnamed protein product [Acanthoscelides obtectus]|uniref:Uncharacterized protein n=1 Tax=Acanthoscelides obtectus TaxID=200917 RepID=A0A9P0LWI5_ACAOB|nr:unnamed protein product [Acanthoscelides obtectus]CAK1668515.1 hypothetical protein AOBTE_LOCUS26450 [Acanthoscelides obtectus]
MEELRFNSDNGSAISAFYNLPRLYPDDSIADSNYEPTDDESSGSSDTNSTASPILAQTADTNDDELSVTSGTNSPLQGSSAASAPRYAKNRHR